jgi:glycine betaine catabolism B
MGGFLDAMTPPDPAHEERRCEVLGVADETADIKTLRLSVPADFSFKPGMWVMLQFPDRAEKANAYSISTSPFEKGAIEFSFANVGALTRRLAAVRPGERLLLRGPYGKWFYRDDVRRAVLISDGAGIAPYRAMARYVLDKKLPNSLTLLCSAKTPDGFIYKGDLERFAEAGMKVYKTITHPELLAPDRTWTGPRGAIDLEVIKREVADLGSSHFYLCGPKALVETLTAGLASAGVPPESIHYEKWGDYQWL